MFYLLHFWLSTLHSMKSHYNSKVQTYHCSTCIKYIYLYQNWVRNQHDTVCTTLVKIDVLDTYGVMICSYFGIIFFLLFKKIENAFYTSFKYNILLFINGLIFDIMNIQSNQSLVMFSWSLSKIGWILFSNANETLATKDAGQKVFILWANIWRIENKH